MRGAGKGVMKGACNRIRKILTKIMDDARNIYEETFPPIKQVETKIEETEAVEKFYSDNHDETMKRLITELTSPSKSHNDMLKTLKSSYDWFNREGDLAGKEERK